MVEQLRSNPEELTSYEQAEQEFLGRGVPAEVLEAARQLDQPPDLPNLAHELDRFTAYGFGPASKRRFLQDLYPKEFGVRTYELLSRPGGGEVLSEYIEETLASFERSL